MSYSITPDQEVLKDGEKVGYIQGGICYTDDPPKGRGISSFRAMAGIPDLKFEPLPQTVETDKPEVGVTVEVVPVAETVTITAPALPEPPMHPHYGDKTPEWQKWFVATYGAEAFTARWPKRQLPQ